MRKQLLWGFLVLVLIGLLGLAACSSPNATTSPPVQAATATQPAISNAAQTTGSTSGTPKLGGTLRFATDMFPQSNLGWIGDGMNQIGGTNWPCAFYDNLLNCDYQGNITPDLATAYQVAPDLKSITLTLRQGVKFHDGSDWNATVAKWNIDQLINAKVGYWINLSSVDVVDNYTVRLNVKSWSNSILSTMGETPMTSKAAYDAHGANKDAEEWLRWHPVGTGPFKFDSFTADVSLKGVKFNDYWQKGKPYLDAIEFDKVVDPMTKSSAFTAGEYDVFDGDLSKIEYDLKQKGANVEPVYLAIFTLGPDSKNPNSPYANPKVRQALDYAINRTEIVNTLGYGWWAATSQYSFPGTSTYINSLPNRDYNPDKAKQLLADAGFPKGFHTQILGNAALTNKDVAVAIQRYLSNVNITADLNMADNGQFWGMMMQGWEGLNAVGMMVTSADMNLSFNNLFSQNTPTFASMQKTDEFQALLNAASAAPKYDASLTQKCTQYIYDNSMVIPVYSIERGAVEQSYVHGLNYGKYIAAMYFEPQNTWLSK